MDEHIARIKITATDIEDSTGDNLPEDTLAIELSDQYSNIDNDNPACGIAFRLWLCKP